MASTDELAEDYKASLEDLTFNSRYEIGNLTVIARENIQSAQAIARTLETHIHQTSPARKLPALYLLDSIAKNVGTPYTLFFQRNLYQTFMDAYLVVELPVRRKLEEMLQTWKQPVPGSTSAQPVFSADITRKIDTALIKARTAALHQQHKMRQTQEALSINRRMGRTPPPQHMRNTPPPVPNGNHQYPNGQGFDYGRNGAGTPVPRNGNTVGGERIYLRPYSHTMSQPVMNSSTPVGIQLPLSQAMPSLPTTTPLGGSVDTLHSDINRLLESSQATFARDPTNHGLVERVQALLDLQRILQTQQLPQDQLAIVREQVRALANPTPPPQVVAPPPPPPPPPQPLPISFSTQDLAALLATATQAAPMSMPSQPPPVPLPAMIPPIPPPPPLVQTQQNQGTDASSLFASLQAAGLIPGMNGLNIPPPPPLTSGAPLPFPVPGSLPQNLVGNMPGNMLGSSTPNMKKDWRSIDVEMKSASLKIPRPHLIPLLDETLPNKCSSCAHRCEASDKGKKQKAAHLDWHFRVRQRMNESLKTGQTRSWYVDEEDWIHYREDDDDTGSVRNAAADSSTTNAQAQVEELKKQYVVVPDPSESHKICPICQEELRYVWHAETDEFVWMDAKQVGSRIYHATCHAEASKDKASGAIASREGTPSSVPGSKRKAEDDDLNPKIKIKKEPM